MKKIITVLIVLISLTGNSQIQFEDEEYFTAAIITDPGAVAIGNGGLNLGAEIGLNSYWGYVRAFTNVFPEMDEVSYMYSGIGLGLNFKYGNFSPFRYYAGGRLGAIVRNWESGYPAVGAEGGINFLTEGDFVIGVRGTYDYRTDFKYWNNDSEWLPSGFLRFGIIF